MKQSTKSGGKGFEELLRAFLEKPSLYYATEAFLKEGFGIITSSNNPDEPDNDYFRDKDFEFQYVRKALGKVSGIYPVGAVSRKSFKKGVQPSNERYDRILVYSLQGADLTRDDISSLTRAFNRINSVNDREYNRHNRPVMVIVRQGRTLSLSTCERTPESDREDRIGNAVVLYGIDCERPRQGHLQILAGMEMGLKKCASFDDLFLKLIKSLSIDLVSENFFIGYTKLFKDIIEAVSDDTKVIKEFGRFPDPKRALRNYVKKLMGRLVFIQFLQRKGWMGVPAYDDGWTGGDPEFIQNLFERTERKDAFVEEVLQPLFRDLNTKGRRDDLASDVIGSGIKLPYLNGGLFDEKDEYAGVRFSLSGDLMHKMLEFFRSYNFTIDENSKDSVEVGVDPEMLSRIFESLLEDNNATGSFYTPKEIVDYMCQEALATYLQEGEADESKKKLYKEFILSRNPEILSPEDRDYVEGKLRDVKICDPAIGSGAFPMGMLKVLFECRKALEEIRNGEASDPSAIKKDILQNSIYGVDIDRGAVDIARLRFWLALIIDEKTPHTLPNMDFKIMQGNSLIEQYEGVDLSRLELSEKRRRGKNGNASQLSLVTDAASALENIQKEIREYYNTNSYDGKTSLRDSINDNIKEYIRHLKDCTPEIGRKLEKLPIPNDQFFLWHIYFKEVFDKGGFDIVIGNPPYIELQDLKQMNKVYAKCGFDTYDSAGDIYCLFTEHGFNLLRRGGTLCYIMMNKWMKAGYGKPLRKYLLKRRIHGIIDFGDVQVFKNATTYPCIILLGNDKPSETFGAYRLRKSDLSSAGGGKAEQLRRFDPAPIRFDEFRTSDLGDDIWVLTSSRDLMLFRKLKPLFPTLEEYLDAPAKRGIQPGYTKAFLISDNIKNSIIEKNASAKEIIVPFLKGDNLRPYEAPIFDKNLILFRKGSTLQMMGKDSTTEEEAWMFIQSRYPSICEWLKPFEEKGRKRTEQGDFWWELRSCSFYHLFERPKIMYQKFQVKPNFIYDTNTSYCDDSMFFIPTEDLALLGLLNSKIGWWLISAYCTLIQSGYQLIWDYFKRLPVALAKDGNEEIAALVDKVLAAKAAGREAEASALRDQIDQCLYELYGLTNGEVKVVDPEAETFGADFEPFVRKPAFKMSSEEDIEKTYNELRNRFNKIAAALDNDESRIEATYDITSEKQPYKEELVDAFNRWNCAILTAFRGSDKLSREANLERNKKRNDELKYRMREQGLLFRPVDGFYIEIQQEGREVRKEKVNEFSFFVANTDREGNRMTDREDEKRFFRKIYRLAEHYEQDSFLFTFPGANRVAFLVATNGAARDDFRNGSKFAGPLYDGFEELDAWTGCSDDGRIAFLLKGMAEKIVPGTRGVVRIGEGDLFDIEHYHPGALVAIHDGTHDGLKEQCGSYSGDSPVLSETVIGETDDIEATILRELNAVPGRVQKIGFLCSVSREGSYLKGAEAAYRAVLGWAATQPNSRKVVIVDIFGEYCKIQG